MSARQGIQDALSAIRAVAPVSGNKYGASLNADGSIQVTKNGTNAPFKVWWAVSGQPAARTDANQGSQDTVTIQDSDGSNSRNGEFQSFLNSLT